MTSKRTHYFANAAVAIFWLGIFMTQLRNLLGPQENIWRFLISLAVLLRNGSLIALFLLRRPPEMVSREIKEWVIAVFGSFIGILYLWTSHSLVPQALQAPIYSIMITALLAGIAAIVTLGFSFGIVPANRGIKTNGLYRFVRHPIYSFYLIFDLGLICISFSLRNMAVFLGFAIACYLRASYEEKLLRLDPAYRDYAGKTPYMFLPGIF
jgi:protein-S-isoprenylcysteine O-methyltransferase Ste14